MLYAIDVVYLSSTGNVVGLRAKLRPWQLSVGPQDAVDCLELPLGAIATWPICVGDQFRFEPAEQAP
jgi:uncharacterized membrane protein (UPF0127 family)